MQINSLAALKRAITIGTRLEVIDHWRKELIGNIRTVTKAQGNGYFYTVPGNEKRLWGEYGKPKEISFPAPGMFRFDLAGAPFSQSDRYWVIRILEANQNESA